MQYYVQLNPWHMYRLVRADGHVVATGLAAQHAYRLRYAARRIWEETGRIVATVAEITQEAPVDAK